MSETQTIRCINKEDRDNPYERIKFVGGVNPDGSRWRVSQQEAIREIEANEWQYLVERPQGDRVIVLVAVSRFKNKYLKTEADGDEPNNLLSLPECR